MIWHLTSPGMFYDRGEHCAVYYHPESGDTHLISALAAAILRELARGEADEATLASQLAESLPLPDAENGAEPEEPAAVIGNFLREMQALDLVSPA